MRTTFKAAVGSLLISGVLAGAAVMPSAASAHGETGPLCWGNAPGGVWMKRWVNSVQYNRILAYGEPFRISGTHLVSGVFLSTGHSASSNQVDYVLETNQLRCDRPPF